MKAKIISDTLLLAAVFFVAYSVVFTFLSPELILKREEGLGEQGLISVETGARGDAFHLGDTISYFVKVKYNPGKIEAIDKSSINKSVILEPFEIRDQNEKELKIDSNTKIYLRKYEIQLINGATNQLYSFPTVTVRYKTRDSGWSDKRIVPEPIFIGARIPIDVTGLELKSQEGRVINMSRQRLPWMFWGLGFFCGALGITKILRTIRRQKREKEGERKRIEGLEDIFEAHQKICQEILVEEGEQKLKAFLHQANQILRTLLTRKEGIGWLEPELFRISLEIRQRVLDLLTKLQRAYSQESLGQKYASEALKELGGIFNFYIKKGEV